MSGQQQDMSREAVVRMPLGYWNMVLQALAQSNPVIAAINQQLQSQMYSQGKANGEDKAAGHQARQGQGRDDNAGVEEGRPAQRVKDWP